MDLLIVDIMMPGMSGLELLRHIKDISPDTEVILMTGNATVENVTEGLRAGAFDYILKPINYEILQFDISRVLEKQNMREKLMLQQVKMVELAKMTAVGQLGAGVAHEMNQPLMAMSAYLESLLLDPAVLTNSEFKEKLLKIKDQFTRMGTIVKRMHDYAGNRTTGFIMEDVNRPVHDGYYILKQQLKNHNITVHEKLSEGLPQVLMDRYQIQDIVINFLINALDAVDDRFHKEGGGEMTLISKKMATCEAVLVGIIDNGVPVKEGTEQDIFNPFFTTKQPGRGTGLGLSVSHGITKNHNGLLAFRKLSGERKIFYFVLPAKEGQCFLEEDAVLAKDIKEFLDSL